MLVLAGGSCCCGLVTKLTLVVVVAVAVVSREIGEIDRAGRVAYVRASERASESASACPGNVPSAPCSAFIGKLVNRFILLNMLRFLFFFYFLTSELVHKLDLGLWTNSLDLMMGPRP